MSRQGSARRSGAPLSLILLGAVAIAAALVVQRIGGDARSAKDSRAPAASAAGVAAGAGPSAAAPSRRPASGAPGILPRALPAGLEDRGWIAEVGVQRWLAGSLSGRVLALPPDEIALTATSTSVVSVRYGSGGRTSTVRVRDLGRGTLRASVDRPGTVSSAVLAGDLVYVTGDAGAGGGSDAGVQAISLADGAVQDVIAPGPAPADAVGPVTRTQLRLDRSGTVLGSPLCSGNTCSIDLVDLTTGLRTTPVHNGHGFLVALTNRVLYITDDSASVLDAIDAATGDLGWRLDDVQLQGVLPTSDGSSAIVGFLPATSNGGPTFTLASADATSGALRILLRRAVDAELPTFYPGLSGDRFAVIGGGGALGELLGIRRRVALSLVDAATGVAQQDAVTITAP